MNNIVIKNSEVVSCKEVGISKKIKVDGTKLGMMKEKSKSVPVIEEKAFDLPKFNPSVKPVETARHIPNFQKVEEQEYTDPDFVVDEVKTVEENTMDINIPGEPISFDRSINKELFEEINPVKKPVVEEKAEKVDKPKIGEYVVPTIVSPGNTGDRTEKFKKLLQTTEEGTYVWKVLSNGVDRLTQNKEAIAQIKEVIKKLSEEIQKLENQKAIVSSGKKNIEELLSATMPISLSEIRAAAETEAFSKANAEIAKIKDSVSNLASIKEETEENIQQIDERKDKLKDEKSQQESVLSETEKKGVELCNTLEKDLTTATQIEKLKNEQRTLEQQLNLLKEEAPKKPTSVNPFDKLRDLEQQAEAIKTR